MTQARRLTSILFVAWFVCASSPGSGQERVTLATANAVTAVISQVGVQKGAFKEVGLEVDIKRLPGGNDTIQALLGGAAEFAEASNAQFLSAASKGLPVVAIGVHSYGYLGKLIAANRSANLKSLADFKGKRIGIQVGTGAYTVFLMAIESQGLKPADFVMSNIRVADMPAAMMSDTFDAVLAWDPQAQRIIELKRGKEVISSRDFEKVADIRYPFILMTSAKLIRDKPDLVQKYVNGFVKAKAIVDKRRPEAIAIYRSLLPPDTAAAVSEADAEAAVYSVIRYDYTAFATHDLDELRRTAEFLNRQGTLSTMPDMAKSLDSRFVLKAIGTQ